jgi:hypothetical protein
MCLATSSGLLSAAVPREWPFSEWNRRIIMTGGSEGTNPGPTHGDGLAVLPWGELLAVADERVEPSARVGSRKSNSASEEDGGERSEERGVGRQKAGERRAESGGTRMEGGERRVRVCLATNGMTKPLTRIPFGITKETMTI